MYNKQFIALVVKYVTGSKKRCKLTQHKNLQNRQNVSLGQSTEFFFFYLVVSCMLSFTSGQNMNAEFSRQVVQIASYI